MVTLTEPVSMRTTGAPDNGASDEEEDEVEELGEGTRDNYVNDGGGDDEKDQDDEDDEDAGQRVPPHSIRVTNKNAGKRLVSDQSSSSGDSTDDISDMILGGHNIGTNTDETILEKAIGKWVRKEGFKCQKFIVNSKYGAGSPLFFHCMKACLDKKFDNSTWIAKREGYFDKYGKYIKRTLNHKRNCCQSSVKATIRALFQKKVFDETSLEGIVKGPPNLAAVNGDVMDSDYAKLLTNFLRAIVGDADYAINIAEKPIPQWVNTTDEALAIILVENCWNQECDIFFDGKLSPDEFVRRNGKTEALGLAGLDPSHKASPCRWSNGGPGSTGCQGWTRNGILRFNELLASIEGWRSTDNGQAFYNEIHAREMAVAEGRKKKRKKLNEDDVDTLDVGCNWESV